MKNAIVLLGTLLLAGCAALPSPAERAAAADALASARGWQGLHLSAPPFALQAYGPSPAAQGDVLTVYIEGDGLAWIDSRQPSADPTPRDPLVLRLALAQPDGNAVYLGRPCQYGGAGQGGCDTRYWTGARFAPEVVAAMNEAVTALKARYGARRLVLVGYSGGGAVAALVAARRDDVMLLLTVAGNLDHRTWTALQRIDPLSGSLNAADMSAALARVPQWHWVGAADRVVPPAVADAYATRFPADQRPTPRRVTDFDHVCCWIEQWPRLWREATEGR